VLLFDPQGTLVDANEAFLRARAIREARWKHGR
jgi:hypothetical protein